LLLIKLEKRADGGSEKAKDEIQRLRWTYFTQFQKDIDKKARVGHKGRERPAAFHHVDKPLQEEDDPAILEIVNRRKSERGKWIELKDELLKRIFNLAYPE